MILIILVGSISTSNPDLGFPFSDTSLLVPRSYGVPLQCGVRQGVFEEAGGGGGRYRAKVGGRCATIRLLACPSPVSLAVWCGAGFVASLGTSGHGIREGD